ncbi:MAG: sugar ABC transporter substrate-binding protein [Nocardioidaceae bacterium]
MNLRKSLRSRRTKIALVSLAAVLTMAVAAGCSTTSSSQDPGKGASATTDNETALASLAKGNFSVPELPKLTVPKSKNVWLIPCGSAAPGCAYYVNEAKKAFQDQLGWKVTVYDGQFTPATQSAGIQQAITAHADAIGLVAIDCAGVKPALQNAKKAGIPVVTLAAFDCSESSQGGTESLFVQGDPGGSAPALAEGQGSSLAEYIGALNPNAKILLETEPEVQLVGTAAKAFKADLPKYCPGCTVVTEMPAMLADIGNGKAAAQLSAALLQHQDVDTIVATQDAELTYTMNALRTATKKYDVISTGGMESDLQLIKSGQMSGIMGNDPLLTTYEWVDTTVRSVLKEPVVQFPFASALVDSEHNTDADGNFVPLLDVKSKFHASWGQ